MILCALSRSVHSESVHTAPDEGSVLVVVGEGDVDETLVDVVEQDDDEAAACKANQFLNSIISIFFRSGH